MHLLDLIDLSGRRVDYSHRSLVDVADPRDVVIFAVL